MLRRQGGAFAVVSSIAGRFGAARVGAYAASKHALHGFFESLRAEVRENNIQVSIALPGFVDTEITRPAGVADDCIVRVLRVPPEAAGERLDVFLSGALILIGSIAMTKFQRVYEAAVLKTLGARRKILLLILLAEYGLLGLVAGIIGSAAAVGLSYATSRYVFDIEWSFTPEINLAGMAITVVMVIVVGAASTIDVLSRKPLAILRSQ